MAQFRTLVRAGELVRLRRGVYATAKFANQAAENDVLRHIVRIAAANGSQRAKGAVASHESAAMLHGIDLLKKPDDDVVRLTRPRGRYRNGAVRGVRFHSAAVPDDQVTEVLGIRVTTPARTVIDLARTMSYTEGVVSADSALRAGITTKAELAGMLEFCEGWPGTIRARKAVEFSDPRSESAFESAARVCFDQFGLPAPDLQVNIVDDQLRFIGRVDFVWEKYKTIAEADGMGKYGNADDARNQIRRDIRLRAATYKVVHFTWAEVFGDPAGLIARIRKAYEAPSAF